MFSLLGAPSRAGFLDGRWMAFACKIFRYGGIVPWIAQGHSFNRTFNCLYLDPVESFTQSHILLLHK